jgi:hypothetical protein
MVLAKVSTQVRYINASFLNLSSAEPALREMGSFRQPLAEQNSHHAQPSKSAAGIRSINRSQDTVLSPQTTASRVNRVVKPKVQTWDGKMRELKPKRKKRTYGQDEAAKVARNRGSACEDHRRLKIKVSETEAFKYVIYYMAFADMK